MILAAYGVSLAADEIFVSDGAKSDTGNIGDIFGVENTVAVCDPIYPVYVDTNVMAGRAGDLLANGRWSNFVYLPCTAEHHFLPELPTEHADLIYLCFPNNPTGMAIDFDGLKQWVDYANREGSVILYDAASKPISHRRVFPTVFIKSRVQKTVRLNSEAIPKLPALRAYAVPTRLSPKS